MYAKHELLSVQVAIEPESTTLVGLSLAMASSSLCLKRSRVDEDNAFVAHQFRVFTPSQNEQYLPLAIYLHRDGQVSTNHAGKHGSWTMTLSYQLFITWNWRGDAEQLHEQCFVRIRATDCWRRINCEPQWSTMLMPLSKDTDLRIIM